MVVTPAWKLGLMLFLGVAEAWLRNFFSTPRKRAQRYRQDANEEAFETWLNGGAEFAKFIEDGSPPPGVAVSTDRSGSGRTFS